VRRPGGGMEPFSLEAGRDARVRHEGGCGGVLRLLGGAGTGSGPSF
jgi:hypothetical protein